MPPALLCSAQVLMEAALIGVQLLMVSMRVGHSSSHCAINGGGNTLSDFALCLATRCWLLRLPSGRLLHDAHPQASVH